MATLGLIGSGNIGGTLARLGVDGGYEVVLSNSRGPETLSSLVSKLGPGVSAGYPIDVAASADLIVVTIPIHAYPGLAETDLAGRIVLDTGNYYPDRDGHIAELADRSLTDSEYLGRFLPGARIVKVFNNIFYKHLARLARPSGAEDRSALPVAGDDHEAKQVAIHLLDGIGYDAVDVGPLAEGWRQQPGTPVYGTPYGSFSDEAGHPAGVDVVRAALAAAIR